MNSRCGSIPSEMLGNARKQLVKIGTAKTMWAAVGLMALFYIAPGFSTAVFYRQQNELHMNTQAQGFLQLIAGITGIAGRARLRLSVPPPQPPHPAGVVHACRDGGQPGLPVLYRQSGGRG